MSWLQSFLVFLGRVCIGATFLYFAYYGISMWDEAVKLIAEHDIPQPQFYFIGSTLAYALGGIMLLLGWRTRIGACILLIAMGVHTYFFHDFWNMTDANLIHHNQMIFAMNVTIFGGLLYVLSCGAGCCCCDKKCKVEPKEEMQ